MKHLTLECQANITGGAQTAGCLGGILTGLVGGASTGFKVGKYFSFVGIGWGNHETGVL